jgi:CheY-like chemotaxis protein
MNAPNPVSVEKYMVACNDCAVPFDALRAQWCECLSRERSFACPKCGACVCSAPQPVRDRFWSDAPRSMWARRREGPPSLRVPSSVLVLDPSRPSVLVADDEEKIRQIAARVIRGLGLNVALAENGLRCLEMARATRPRVVLADALMPKMDGREVCRQLKEDPATASIRVIIMTSVYVNPKYVVEARTEFHADDYLCKPVTPTAIETTLAKYLSVGVRARRSMAS